jgi:PTH1 family peptidyl-tRNA hydrolase
MNYLIVGLGNIGAEYSNTRHNIGFMVLDAWTKASNTSFTSNRYGSIAEISYKGRKFILLKPSTYMNLSGKAVNYWLQQTKIPIENLLVVLDDLALPFGTLRMRKKGSDGGHNGLKNINLTLNTDQYSRLRIGIGDKFRQGGQVDYVLGKLSPEEEKELPFTLDKAIEAIKTFGTAGIDQAMTQFNQSSKKEE